MPVNDDNDTITRRELRTGSGTNYTHDHPMRPLTRLEARKP